MTKDSITDNQIKTCVDRMGGRENFFRFLRGEGEIVFDTILQPLAVIDLPYTGRSCDVFNCFSVDGDDDDAKVRIVFISHNFVALFGRQTEEVAVGTSLAAHTLMEESSSAMIRRALNEGSVMIPSQIFALLEVQARGNPGNLLTDGRPNIFYLRYKSHGTLFIVTISWYQYRNEEGWYINVEPSMEAHCLHTGSRVFTLKHIEDINERNAIRSARS